MLRRNKSRGRIEAVAEFAIRILEFWFQNRCRGKIDAVEEFEIRNLGVEFWNRCRGKNRCRGDTKAVV